MNDIQNEIMSCKNSMEIKYNNMNNHLHIMLKRYPQIFSRYRQKFMPYSLFFGFYLCRPSLSSLITNYAVANNELLTLLY